MSQHGKEARNTERGSLGAERNTDCAGLLSQALICLHLPSLLLSFKLEFVIPLLRYNDVLKNLSHFPLQLLRQVEVWPLLPALLEGAPYNLLAIIPCSPFLSASHLPRLAPPTMASDCCGTCKLVLV